MNVLFLNPPFLGKFSRTSRSPAITRGGTIYYPFWLAYAIGVLDQENQYKIKFIDAPAENISLEKTLEQAKNHNPKLIVIDTSTPSIYSDAKIAKKLKNLLPNSFIVFVGTHPSAQPEETLNLNNSIDAIAKGEYDYTIKDLAKAIKNNNNLTKVKGLILKINNKIINTEQRPLIKNINKIPFASKVYNKYFNTNNYFFAASDYPMVMIITGRGCPNRCFFCVYPQTFHDRTYRFRSAKNVVNEFEYITKNMTQIREIGIEDDTFTTNQKRVIQICKLLIKQNINIKWYCNVRANLKLETMIWMKKAGCHLMTIGFESGNQNILNNIRKGITINQIKEFNNNAKKAKILVHGCFMAGNPGETKKTLKETLNLAKKLNCDSMQFYPLTPYPGTDAYKWAKTNNYLNINNYRNYLKKDGTYNFVISLPNLPSSEIIKFCNQATKEYYLRANYIFMKIKQILLNPQEIKRTMIASKTFFKYLKQ